MNRRSRHHSYAPSRGRYYAVVVVLATLGSIILARAADIQLVRNDFYQREGDARHIRQVAISAGRGSIVDRNGEALAVSTPVESLWGHPGIMLTAPEKLPALAKVLDMPSDELVRKIGQRAKREFVYLKRHAAPGMVAAALELEVPGVSTQREYHRYYPAGQSAAHVLGFTNIDDQGQEGLELAFDEWLSGQPGSKRVVRDRIGQVIEDIELVEQARPGRDLVTSIDRRLQYLAYRELKKTVDEFGAQSGSVVVLEVATGEILAMVNQPSYNPNDRNSAMVSQMRNRAVTDLFEPGSVIKPFTVAAALESGQYRPDSLIDTNPGYMQLGRFTIRDHRNYGVLDMTGILTKSSNVGASRLALSLEARHLWDVYQRFGFGEVSGTGFPGESPGILQLPERWREVEQAAVSYGYGMSSTALQLAQAYAAIANNGRVTPPTFVAGAGNPARAVIDPSLAKTLIGMMETVTNEQGTGTRAAISHYRVAGKTGTSRKASGEGYSDRYVATFAGIAPVTNPRLVVISVINDPSSEAYYGGEVAAPVFRAVMGAALRLNNIPPDDLLTASPGQLIAGDIP